MGIYLPIEKSRTLQISCSVRLFGGRKRGNPPRQKNIEGVYMGLKIV